MKKILIYLCVIVLTFGSIGVSMPLQVKAASGKVEEVQLNYNTYVLKAGQSMKLKASCFPASAKNKKVKWKSSKSSVATVAANGKVKAKKIGKAKITVTAKDGSKKKAVCVIKVVKKVKKIKSIQVSGTKTELKPGESVALTASIKPSKVTLKTLQWETSNHKVATVTKNGVVTAIAEGSVTITAKAQDGSKKKASINLVVKKNQENAGNTDAGNDDAGGDTGGSGGNTGDDEVKPIAITAIAFEEQELEMREGKTKLLKPSIEPANATNQVLQWSSSDTEVIEVDSWGNLTTKACGTAIITAATTDGSALSVSCEIKVLPGVTLANAHTTTYYAYELDRNASQFKQEYTKEGQESESYMEASKIAGNVFKWSFYVSSNGGITTNAKFCNFMKKLCEADGLAVFGIEGISVTEVAADNTSLTLTKTSDTEEKEILMEAINIVETGTEVKDPNGLVTKASKISFKIKNETFYMQIYDNGNRLSIYRFANAKDPIMDFQVNNVQYVYLIRMAMFYADELEGKGFQSLQYMNMYNVY